ncbi:RNA pseudouridine synthase [Flavobacteriaceae bacterium Ap0902]|nr:RNA pseudouridine synthase [Flavobacteriaceae bacterium Ap0902]
MPPLQIIFENSDFVVINKAAGLISERSPFEDVTVESLLYQYLEERSKKPYVGVIHRLDRVTSGVLIFAKKKNILIQFNQFFRERKIHKTYLAIVQNKPRKDEEILKHFLIKNQKDKRADITIHKTKESVSATLSYEIINKNEYGYLLKIKPKTGRFHQIRAQLSHIGCPIIGDVKYGSPVAYFPLSIALHAWKLNFPMFKSDKPHAFIAGFPQNEFWKFL